MKTRYVPVHTAHFSSAKFSLTLSTYLPERKRKISLKSMILLQNVRCHLTPFNELSSFNNLRNITLNFHILTILLCSTLNQCNVQENILLGWRQCCSEWIRMTKHKYLTRTILSIDKVKNKLPKFKKRKFFVLHFYCIFYYLVFEDNGRS